MKRRRHSLLVLVAAGVLLASACSRFERRGDSADMVVGDPSAEVPTTEDGSTGADEPTTSTSSTTTLALTPPPTVAPSAPQPVEGRTVVRTGVENRSVVDHPGWRVTLTVGDRASHAVTDEVPIEVRLQNTSPQARHHQIDQPDSVVITSADQPDRRAWSHLECNPTLAIYEQPGGLRVLEAGGEIALIVRYPISEDCRLPAGDYLVFGQWSVCPDDARRETANPGTYSCEDGRAYFVDAGPVPLALR